MSRMLHVAWRELVAAQTPPEHDAALTQELDRIVDAARKELLAGDADGNP